MWRKIKRVAVYLSVILGLLILSGCKISGASSVHKNVSVASAKTEEIKTENEQGKTFILIVILNAY